MKRSRLIALSLMCSSALFANADEGEKFFVDDEDLDLSSLFSVDENGKLFLPTEQGKIAAASDEKTQESAAEARKELQTGDATTPAMVGTNRPARPLLHNGTGLAFDAELLVWQAVEDGLPFAYQGKEVDSGHVRHAMNPHFHWDCGFRLGLNYDFRYDGWDVKLTWTEINNKANGSGHFDTSSGYQVWTVANQVLAGANPSVHAHWKVDLNQVDFSFGRQFYISPHVLLRPNGGFRTAFIFQKYTVDFETSLATQNAQMAERFFGFGFFGSLETEWKLAYKTALFGDFGLSGLLGFFNVHQQGKQSGESIWDIQDSFRTIKPVFDFTIGVKWGDTFFDEKVGVIFKVGYEYHLYLNQNQFLVSSGSNVLETFNSQRGDLGYQGVSIAALISF